jgi:hypothetical protein
VEHTATVSSIYLKFNLIGYAIVIWQLYLGVLTPLYFGCLLYHSTILLLLLSL